MELFTALGINSTLFIQMGVFLVGFVFLKYVLFDAYYKAFESRAERTVGQVDMAEKYLNDTKALEMEYSAQARKINEEYRTIYDQTKSEATKEYSKVVEAARAEAKAQIESNRNKIFEQAQMVKKQMAQEIPQLTALISSKLLGKELH